MIEHVVDPAPLAEIQCQANRFHPDPLAILRFNRIEQMFHLDHNGPPLGTAES
jgi:hypothetical protein